MSSTEDPELTRYKEYLQRSIRDDRWESLVADSWRRFDPTGLRTHAQTFGIDAEIVAEWAAALEDAHPATCFDQPDLAIIFRPLLRRIETAAQKVGVNLLSQVDLVSSTDLSPTPFARPAAGAHLLFVGIGTGKFCNSWAKALTSIAAEVWQKDAEFEPPDEQQVFTAFQRNQKSASLAFYLLYCFGTTGSVVAADDREHEDEWMHAHRAGVLDAMELFVIGHEYAHFVAHEQFGAGNLTSNESLALEHFCDELGLRLSREASFSPANRLTFCGVGAIIFLRAVEACDHARNICFSKGMTPNAQQPRASEQTHPEIGLRIQAIKKSVVATTPEKYLKATVKILECYDQLMASAMSVMLTILDNSPPEKFRECPS